LDSLTQGLLGAVTFAVIKDKKIGKKSLLIGAIVGTIPDLDVLLSPLFNDIEFLTVHRSFSHSIGFAIILSLLLGEVFHRYYKRKLSRTKWQFAFFLRSNKGLRNALILSTCYLIFGLISKNHAFYHFKSQLDKEKITFEDVLVSPTPLNSFLWHGIAKTKSGYHFATYSIFDGTKNVKFQFVESDNQIIDEVKGNRLIKYYLDYTQKFPLIETDEFGNTKVYAIKYGPINYYGKPEFVYPLTFNRNDLSEENIKIEYKGKQRGPVKNYKSLIKRIFAL